MRVCGVGSALSPRRAVRSDLAAKRARRGSSHLTLGVGSSGMAWRGCDEWVFLSQPRPCAVHCCPCTARGSTRGELSVRSRLRPHLATFSHDATNGRHRQTARTNAHLSHAASSFPPTQRSRISTLSPRRHALTRRTVRATAIRHLPQPWRASSGSRAMMCLSITATSPSTRRPTFSLLASLRKLPSPTHRRLCRRPLLAHRSRRDGRLSPHSSRHRLCICVRFTPLRGAIGPATLCARR